MRRPESLALPVAALAAVVVSIRSVQVFQPVRETTGVDLMTLSVVSRVAWSALAVGGFAAVGYAYGRRASENPRQVVGLAAVSALVGVLAGFLLLRLVGDATWPGSVAGELLAIGVYAVLDALTFAFVTLGGYALAPGDVVRNGR